MTDAREKSLGLCIGASSIKVVELAAGIDGLSLGRRQVISHNCDIRTSLQETFDLYDPSSYDYVCATGRKLRDLVRLPCITEPEASEHALRFVLQLRDFRFRALLSLGSESFILYEVNEEGTILNVRTGNKCASGTGEFFLQQIARMGVTVDEASRVSEGAEPYSVSGRCSVFCKSDCTHALNKGIPLERVSAGLGDMIAEKAIELLGPLPRKDILVVGGVTKNAYVVNKLRGRIENCVIPEYADVFEALGAAAHAMTHRLASPRRVTMVAGSPSFTTLPPLKGAEGLVTFQAHDPGLANDGDETIFGLDVGSTTTKAVLIRTSDDRILASVYLRTNGNPIQASRRCYQETDRQLAGVKVKIGALGVTGSGRHIAGLHAQSDAVINEIIAHATAAAFFDSDVDTILEIGGQDAKYTFLVNGVPCDYAMNEACSAGTGSFLEEAAKESLNIEYRDIEKIALQAEAPANFNDQCAAFIGSDIKNASHQISKDNIVAGLVYSICMNYNNRVRGSRKMGDNIFMQGGVCYNKAVPLAMAALLQKRITVPPEPGLMGAFGVALEAKQRLSLGLIEPSSFDLQKLAEREVAYGKAFVCRGATELCDRGCAINVIRLNGKNFPFGGICNKYHNAARSLRIDPKPYDLVAKRQDMVFAAAKTPQNGSPRKSVGLPRSFLTNLLFPLYHHFFDALGFRVILSDSVDPEGIKRANSSFCFPAELSHGMMADLLRKAPDYVFLPHVSELCVENSPNTTRGYQCTCVIVQGEPSYLRSAFRDSTSEVLSPSLEWSKGWESMSGVFVKLAKQLGCQPKRAAEAYGQAVVRLKESFAARRRMGEEALREIERDPSQIGIVLFGRSYNAFAGEANMGLPRKFASRGLHCVPHDCLPVNGESSMDTMNWAAGHDIVRAARFVKKHPQLFGAFVTNFSCGPDAFLVKYFRDIMKTKPSLTLEFDSHTADVGVTTRVEAFLDIIERYRKLGIEDPPAEPFRKAELVLRDRKPVYIASDGSEHSLNDPRVKVIFPSMGRTLAEMGAAVFRGYGIRSDAVPPPDGKVLMRGRANASCKECLPLILITGSMVDYVERFHRDGDLLLYFMPASTGGCRLAQYRVHLTHVIDRKKIPNLALYSLTPENSYGGLGLSKVIAFVKGIVIADVMEDMKNALHVLAVDRDEAANVFQEQWRSVLQCVADGGTGLYRVLERAASQLAGVPLKRPLAEAKKVLMAGESFVRKDEFSSQAVIELLARREIVVQRAHILEWFDYIDYFVRHVERNTLSLSERFEVTVRRLFKSGIEKRIKRVLSQSGLYEYEVTEIESILKMGEPFLDYVNGGEPIVVVGRFFRDILKHFDGMISIGPFACLPTRIVEAILAPESRTTDNDRLSSLPDAGRLRSVPKLPFLSIEADGNPFPQIVEAQIEAFCLQVERVRQITSGGRTSHRRFSLAPLNSRGGAQS